jgi:hypothetical protein
MKWEKNYNALAQIRNLNSHSADIFFLSLNGRETLRKENERNAYPYYWNRKESADFHPNSKFDFSALIIAVYFFLNH